MLDCSDPATAAATLATVLQVDSETLAGVIGGSADLDPAEVEVEDILWARLREAGATVPLEPYEARFFHGTRTLAPERFTALGVLRLAQAIDGIWGDLHARRDVSLDDSPEPARHAAEDHPQALIIARAYAGSDESRRADSNR